MVLRLLPNVERLCVDWLRTHASISALVGTRVHTELPPLAEGAPLRDTLTVSLVAGTEVVREHFDASLVQLLAWGETKASANLLVRTARAAMLEMPTADHDLGVVTQVRTSVGPRWFPDDSVSPPHPRYHADFGVWVHPHPL